MSGQPVCYRPEFFVDAAAVTRWYENRQDGLGVRFLDALDVGRNSINASPESFPIVANKIRVCSLKRFPYGIYFRALPQELLFLGVLHLHRDADAWKDRLTSPDDSTSKL